MPFDDPSNPSGRTLEALRNHTDGMQQLLSCLHQVEVKHQDYFNSLRSAYAPAGEERPAQLREFVFLPCQENEMHLQIREELRTDIADECRACLKKRKQ
jgi:hypothetical protein